MSYKLTRIDDTDVFYFASEKAETVGTTLISGSFEQVLGYATTLKTNANDEGSGEFEIIDSTENLSNITVAKWFLIILPNNIFQIVRTDGIGTFNLPTNGQSFTGTLTDIFNKIINLI